ncbi:MAG: GNAT family N-acetyltransferase [Lachnospiraceae bacterium]|nr:GNAT family N-acetyltransferase [Lachnospiraceae bacterium]
MQNHIFYTLSKTISEQIEALYASCVETASGPALLGLALPEADLLEEDTFYALYYIEDTLVSFLSCFCPDGKTAEISGFTAPRFRNQGFFSCLLKEAQKEARNLFGPVSFRFQCLLSDPDTTSFCKARNLAFAYSECMMARQQKETDLNRVLSSPNALSADLPVVRLLSTTKRKTLERLHEKAFFCSPEFSSLYINTVLTEENTVSYVIKKAKHPEAQDVLSASQDVVGLFHLSFQKFKTSGHQSGNERKQMVYLTGLGILPGYRRQGFAEAALRSLFSLLPKNSRLILQVATSNKAAFSLYRKLDFEISSRLDYVSSI